MNEIIVIVIFAIWLAVMSSFVMYLHVFFALKRNHRNLWDRLFSGGSANIKFWQWVGEKDYSEVEDQSLLNNLVIMRKLWWFTVSAVGIGIIIGVIAVVWKLS